MPKVATSKVPSPDTVEEVLPTAQELLDKIRMRDGRVFRMREICVFVLTGNEHTAEWLMELGGRSYLPRGLAPSWETPLGAYRRERDAKPEWDIYIHTIPVAEGESIWEAAGRDNPTVEAVDYA